VTDAANKQPRALYVLFFAELWERFSFYGMRALLVLYMTKEFLFADERAYAVYGAYTSLVYTFPILGGYLADHVLGYRRSIVLGGVLMALGHFAMAFEARPIFYIALALLCVGNGFFKPNISSLVGQLYAEDDPRRDGGFTIFYMGINLGAFLAPLVCGYIGETIGWHFGFSLAGVGMLAGLLSFWRGLPLLADHGLPPAGLRAPLALGLTREHGVYLLSALLVPPVAWLLYHEALVGYLLYAVGALVLVALLKLTVQSEPVARQRLGVILVLLPFTVVFWAFFEQAGSSLTLFTDRNVDRLAFGTEIPASQFQGVNPAMIIAFAPLFAWLWLRLARRGLEPSTPFKFALGIAQLGLGFLVLQIGAATGDAQGRSPMGWLVGGYFLMTTGELCLSPVGLSMVTKLAPRGQVGLLMGAWFLATAFSQHAAGLIAQLTGGAGGEGGEQLVPAESIKIYGAVFGQIGWVALASAVACLALVPLLKRWMHGIH
jgi:POT family proton-dependent oligopeptide transporter